MWIRRLHRLNLAAILVMAVMPHPSLADRLGHAGGVRPAHDQDRARDALQRGEVRPIAEILQGVSAEVPGEVIEVELEREGHRDGPHWVYELKVITASGRLLEILVDAATGRILAVEED
ncbi:MAG: PepSY domain-containing protein [Thiocapsa sp.]|nr:PepSY domain-containing protein [Thiocapsa sp.]MCG6896772.1 PepSY domain-containing protein [Thiocapsa sp.]MCG6984279.1 PepSY domain-containing protein [Thiocapsa sp.]